MEEKFCTGCQKSKCISEYWLKYGKPQPRCKDCQKEYHKKRYANNVNGYKSKIKSRNKKIQFAE